MVLGSDCSLEDDLLAPILASILRRGVASINSSMMSYESAQIVVRFVDSTG